jgi:hypothetical protein
LTRAVACLLLAAAGFALVVALAVAKPRRDGKQAARAYWQLERRYWAKERNEGRLGRLLRAERRETRQLRANIETLKARHRAVRRLQAAGVPQVPVHYAIRLASVVYGVPAVELRTVGSCESRLYQYAQNGRFRGVFQEGPMFEAGPFGRAGFSVWDVLANVFTAAHTVSREGWGQWECRP